MIKRHEHQQKQRRRGFSLRRLFRWPRSKAPPTRLQSLTSTTLSSVDDDAAARAQCTKFYVCVDAPGEELLLEPSGHSRPGVAVAAVGSSSAWTAGVRAGDVLETIAGMAVSTVANAQALLQRSLRPTILRFRSLEPVKTRVESVTVKSSRKLGVTITADGADRVFVVTQTPTALPWDIRLGDVLVAVNGHTTTGMDAKDCQVLLSQAASPWHLSFQRVVCDTADCSYDDLGIDCLAELGGLLVTWCSGPLGIALVEDPISGCAVVHRLTGQGTTKGIARLEYGDSLIAINGRSTEHMAFSGVCQQLKRAPKPTLLWFEPMHPARKASLGNEWHCDSSSLGNSSDSGNDHQDHGSALTDTYELVWDGVQRMGLVLDLYDDYPRIAKVRPHCQIQFSRHPIGDALVFLNGVCMYRATGRELHVALVNAVKPAVLQFRRCSH